VLQVHLRAVPFTARQQQEQQWQQEARLTLVLHQRRRNHARRPHLFAYRTL
jgi:hypothetical protein